MALLLVGCAARFEQAPEATALIIKSPAAAAVASANPADEAPLPPYTLDNHSAQRDQVVRTALAKVGRPYRYGGNNPEEGFDCSGLVAYSYARIGVELPRSSHEQWRHARPLSLESAKPGDVLFYRIRPSDPQITHIAIYLGDNRAVHAPSSGKRVLVTPIDTPYWQRRFVSAGTFFN